MSQPNFFLVGAPKCGTSSMHDYLGQHPQVFVSWNKEPHYFDRDFKTDSIWCVRDPKAYDQMFAEANGAVRVGESTTWYLYSQQAAREIHDFNPNARIIAMLRHPVDAMYSLHGHYLYSGQEQITNFNEALAAEPDRIAGKRVDHMGAFPESMIYSEVFRYAGQLKRYYDLFGRENVQAILFDDFVRDTAGVYRRTLEFLGLDPNFNARFEIVNPAKTVSLGLSKFLLKRPTLRKAIHSVIPRRWQLGGYTALAYVTGRFTRSARTPPDLRAQLMPRVADDISELEELLGRKLPQWRK